MCGGCATLPVSLDDPDMDVMVSETPKTGFEEFYIIISMFFGRFASVVRGLLKSLRKRGLIPEETTEAVGALFEKGSRCEDIHGWHSAR